MKNVTLPRDCLTEICRHIYNAADIARFSCVNRECRDLMKRPEHVHVYVRNKTDARDLSRWVHTKASHLRRLHIYGNCHLWSMFWRYLPVTIAPYLLDLELVHDQEACPLTVPSIEDIAPISENLQSLDIVAIYSVHLGSSISRYRIMNLDVTCPIITCDWLAFASSTYERIFLTGHAVMPETFSSIQIPPVFVLKVTSAVLAYCADLFHVVELHVRWDGDFAYSVHAPRLEVVYLYGGEWDTSWIPPNVKQIWIENGTITQTRPQFSVHCTEKHVVLQRM